MKRAKLHTASKGFALLSEAYRPFFLLAGIWGAVSMILWILIVAEKIEISAVMADGIWHQHEMIFGFAAAAVAGFSLTALPSWTKRPRLAGKKLGALAVVWILGRFAFLFSDSLDAYVFAITDMAFLTILSLIAGCYVIGGKNWKNSPIFILITAFSLGNGMVHLELLGIVDSATQGFEFAILSIVLLIAIIGGRVTPAFTRNWLNRQGKDISIVDPMQVYDVIALVSLFAFVVSYLATELSVITACLAIIAAALNLIRVLRWKFWAVLSEPIMWVLHLGYLWLVIGLLMVSLTYVWDELPMSAALHSFTVGGFGTFILAMMTRATLGHSGREIKASLWTAAIYILITVGAIFRVSSPMIEGYGELTLKGAGLCWILAFTLFCIEYAPILTRPRIESQDS